MFKFTYFLIFSLILMIFSGCASFSSMNISTNQSGAKEYHLVNTGMCDDPKNSAQFNNLYVNATYDYIEKGNDVKVTLTNIAQQRVGGLDGSDAVITSFKMYINNSGYMPMRCDEPISNGTLETRSRVENSLSCYFGKNIFYNLKEVSQFSYEINFNRPNVGDLNTIKRSLQNPLSHTSIQCKQLMQLGYTYDQCVFSMWARMPAKKFTREVMHITKEQKINLINFFSHID